MLVTYGYIIFITIWATSMAKRRSICPSKSPCYAANYGSRMFSPGSTMPLSASARRGGERIATSV